MKLSPPLLGWNARNNEPPESMSFITAAFTATPPAFPQLLNLWFNPLKNAAFHALDHAYSIGYLVCGACALLAGAIAFFALGGHNDETLISDESLA